MKSFIGRNGKKLWQPETEAVFAPIREGEDLVQICTSEHILEELDTIHASIMDILAT